MRPNPRALAAWSAACLLVGLGTTNPAYRGLVVASAAVVALATAGSRSSARRLLAGLLLASLSAVVLNGVFSHLGADQVFEIPSWLPLAGGPVTVEGIAFGASTALGLAGAVLAVAPWSLTLESHEVVDALPHHLERTGMLLAAGLSLMPRTARSFQGIAELQKLRGWRPRRPGGWAEVLIPAVLTAVEDSIQLAESMEARAFGSGRRSRYAAPGWGPADIMVIAVSLLVVAGFLADRVSGRLAEWHPYPNLQGPLLAPELVVACLLLVTPALVWRSRT